MPHVFALGVEFLAGHRETKQSPDSFFTQRHAAAQAAAVDWPPRVAVYWGLSDTSLERFVRYRRPAFACAHARYDQELGATLHPHARAARLSEACPHREAL